MNSCILTVSSGTGPVEVRLFVRMLAEEMVRGISRQGGVVTHVTTHGPEDQPSSIDLEVLVGADVVRSWLGTHALILRSDRRAKRDRKRWYAAITCAARQEQDHHSTVDLHDVTFETCRAGGAGGQHVNKTASAVRAIHRPSGLAVRIESERSQHQNKRRAIKELSRMLSEQKAARLAEAESARRAQSIRVERGSPVAIWHWNNRALVRAAGQAHAMRDEG